MENIYELYTPEQLEMIHNSDHYTMFYAILGQQLIDELGVEGESALREATRRYGKDRGAYRRQRHLDANVKINMKNLFSIGSDLPADPRFHGDQLRLIPEERNTHTLRCPMAELWIDEGYQYVGRLYCEEFHPACYSSYAFGYTKVGLAKTLTQKGDEYCAFNIVLRQEDLPEELKPVCFEHYDPYYTGQTKSIPKAEAKTGFNLLTLRVYYYMVEVVRERFGPEGIEALSHGLEKAAVYAADHLKLAAQAMNKPLDVAFADANYPLYWNPDEDPVWEQYNRHGAKELLKKEFYPVLRRELGL